MLATKAGEPYADLAPKAEGACKVRLCIALIALVNLQM